MRCIVVALALASSVSAQDLGTRALLAPDGITVLRLYQGSEVAPIEAVPVELPADLAPWAGPAEDPRLKVVSGVVEIIPGWETRERRRFVASRRARIYRRYAEAKTMQAALSGDTVVPAAFISSITAEVDALAAEIARLNDELR
jgi:hypothetical protein